MSLGVWFAVGPQRVAPSILVADDTATRHSDPRLPARVVVPSVAPVESAPLPPLVLTSGALVVHATAQPRLVETPFGNVRVEAHSVVRVQVHTQRVVIAAWEGSATFSDDARHVAIARGATWSSERRLPAAVSHPTNENDHDRAALTLLAQALSALRRDHDPAAALELLARYRALSPHVSLSHEADLIEAEALVAAGRDKPALRLLDRLNLDGRSDLEHARDQLRREKK